MSERAQTRHENGKKEKKVRQIKKQQPFVTHDSYDPVRPLSEERGFAHSDGTHAVRDITHLPPEPEIENS